MNSRSKNLTKYVLPTVIGNCCFFLFTIIDGIFVGHGVGTDALGAVNLVMPFVMTVNALFMLTTIGGITVTAIRLGRGDHAGANQAFMHSLTGTLALPAVFGASAVWLTFGVYETLTLGIAYALYRYSERNGVVFR